MNNILASGSGHVHFPGPCNGCVFSSTDGRHCTASEEEQEKFHIVVDTKNNAARCSGYIYLDLDQVSEEQIRRGSMINQTIAYVCDQKACTGCQDKNTECHYTTDIQHAVNFERVERVGGSDCYVEKEIIK